MAHHVLARHLVHNVTGVFKNKAKYGIRVLWSIFEKEECRTWDPFLCIHDHALGPLGDFLHTCAHCNFNMNVFGLIF